MHAELKVSSCAQIPYAKWREQLFTACSPSNPAARARARARPQGQAEENALSPLLPLLSEDKEEMGSVATMPRFDLAATSARLLDVAPPLGPVACPAVAAPLLQRYFDFMVACGFLPPPPDAGEQFSLHDLHEAAMHLPSLDVADDEA